MSTQHTPGPWIIYSGSDAEIHRKDGFVLVVSGNNAGRIVANVNTESCPDASSAPAFVRMPADANARLIAAAPDYYAATQQLLAQWGKGNLSEAVQALAAAHAKAQGKD
jgi:hypothetical protein